MPVGSSPELDWYAILGLDPAASDAEIGRAFRSLARRFHPDAGPQASNRQFSEVARAYEVLGDPGRRADYDRVRTGGPAKGIRIPVRRWAASPQEKPSVDISDAGESASAGGEEVEVAISFWESVSGTVTRVGLPRAAVCADCSGTGHRSPGPCPSCGGEGRYHRQPGPIRITHVCSECRGSGARPAQPCDGCGGQGWKQVSRELTVRVPPGVAEGTRLRLRSARGTPVGMARVTIRPDRWFAMEGRDILLRLPLNLAEAALGTTVSVPLPGGAVRVEVPPGTCGGDRLRVRGRGVPGARAGDLVLVAELVVPTEPAPEERVALEALLSSSPDPRSDWPEFDGGGGEGG